MTRVSLRRVVRSAVLTSWIYWICVSSVHVGPPLAVPLAGFNCIVLYFIVIFGWISD